jgi:hypothetical protein
MKDTTFRILVNLISLFFISKLLVESVLDLSTSAQFVPLFFGLFMISIFGCIMTAIDYFKE